MNTRITRRDFTRKLALTGSFIGVGGCTSMGLRKKTPVALQLYTLRELMQTDFKGTVAKVAEIGYDAVELAGYGDMSAKEMKQFLGNLGLQCAGSHEGYDLLSEQLDETIAYNKEIGNKYIICPSMPNQWRDGGADSFRRFGEQLNRIGEKTKQAGIQLCYHNHDFEFKTENGKYLINYLFESADTDLVKSEVDVYWIQYSGNNPVDFIKQYKDRCAMIHMKDMANDAERSFAPVGTGIMDLKSIVAASKAGNAKWYVVEQDRTKRPPLEAISISLQNMRKLLSA